MINNTIMTEKYRGKYRIPSARWEKWDYGWNGAYFVTICTRNREAYFGDCVDGKMNLSEIGELAEKYWKEIPDHFPFVQLGAYVVMPDHVHGIVIIDKMGVGGNGDLIETQNFDLPGDRDTQKYDLPGDRETQNFNLPGDRETQNFDLPGDRETQNFASLRNTPQKNKFGPQSQNLASVIRGYKIGVTQNARKIRSDFAWQARYYDRVIRDGESYRQIEAYIKENPLKGRSGP
jgi:REP element-mobilizing transposase RayT